QTSLEPEGPINVEFDIFIELEYIYLFNRSLLRHRSVVLTTQNKKSTTLSTKLSTGCVYRMIVAGRQ
ncbi:MAG: hypothetical protein ABN482_05980, partial [Corticimicrobacter sp.]|uniref:hypothetical protein n=1 Tax=Corticimicrobacter sp. TaxID=2678536 RepID=UPI0032DBC295